MSNAASSISILTVIREYVEQIAADNGWRDMEVKERVGNPFAYCSLFVTTYNHNRNYDWQRRWAYWRHYGIVIDTGLDVHIDWDPGENWYNYSSLIDDHYDGDAAGVYYKRSCLADPELLDHISDTLVKWYHLQLYLRLEELWYDYERVGKARWKPNGRV